MLSHQHIANTQAAKDTEDTILRYTTLESWISFPHPRRRVCETLHTPLGPAVGTKASCSWLTVTAGDRGGGREAISQRYIDCDGREGREPANCNPREARARDTRQVAISRATGLLFYTVASTPDQRTITISTSTLLLSSGHLSAPTWRFSFYFCT